MAAITDEPTKPIQAGQKPRVHYTCPACSNPYGGCELDQTNTGIPLIRYWHTDTNERYDYCEDRADGSAEQIRGETEDPRNNPRAHRTTWRRKQHGETYE